jgi:hypothetical protein
VKQVSFSVCVKDITSLFLIAIKKVDEIKKRFIELDIYVNCILLSRPWRACPGVPLGRHGNFLRGDHT